MIRRKARVLVRHRVHAEPRCHQSMLQVSGAVVCLPSLMRQVAVPCEQVRWTCEPSPAKFPTLQIQAKGVLLLAVDLPIIYREIRSLQATVFPKIELI